jgi:hypothetical protein
MKTATGRQAKYLLCVGNIGQMAYSNKADAKRDFAFYRECSINLRGRAGSESVQLLDMTDGTVISEYIGTMFFEGD